MSKEAIIEATKEFFRVIVIAVIPVLIDNLSRDVISWRVLAITAAIASLKAIDKLLHEIGAEREEKGTKKDPVESALTLGLTRF